MKMVPPYEDNEMIVGCTAVNGSRKVGLWPTVALLLVLSACQAPTTMAPGVTPQELARERAEQEAMVAKIKAQGGAPKPWKESPQMKKQLTRVAERVEKAGAEMCRALGIHLQRECYFYFSYKRGKEINAYADGENIVVSTGMMAFIESDDELALVLSHEMAHNLLGHPDAATSNAMAGGVVGLLADALAASQGVDTRGQFSQLGAEAGVLRYSRGFEAEADYVGLYIMAAAGYDISNTPYFWRRFSVQDPDGIYGGRTHPSNPERFIALNKTVTEINYKRHHRLPLIPEFQPQQ